MIYGYVVLWVWYVMCRYVVLWVCGAVFMLCLGMWCCGYVMYGYVVLWVCNIWVCGAVGM